MRRHGLGTQELVSLVCRLPQREQAAERVATGRWSHAGCSSPGQRIAAQQVVVDEYQQCRTAVAASVPRRSSRPGGLARQARRGRARTSRRSRVAVIAARQLRPSPRRSRSGTGPPSGNRLSSTTPKSGQRESSRRAPRAALGRQVEGARRCSRHRHTERHPRDDDAGEVEVRLVAAEEQPAGAHQQRIQREERQVAAAALDEGIALRRDAEMPSQVVARRCPRTCGPNTSSADRRAQGR
jgi:hypothetical protein